MAHQGAPDSDSAGYLADLLPTYQDIPPAPWSMAVFRDLLPYATHVRICYHPYRRFHGWPWLGNPIKVEVPGVLDRVFKYPPPAVPIVL